MYKLELEKAEKSEIKLPTSIDHRDHRIIEKARGLQKTIYFCTLTTWNPLTVWITANWKIFNVIGIPDHLTCLPRNLYPGQEGTVRTGHGTMDWFKIGKGVWDACVLLLPHLFNLYAEYIMYDAGLDDSQAEINTAGRNTNNLRYADYYHSVGGKSLTEGERGEWKIWLKTQYSKNEDHGIWFHHFMANRWEKKVEIVTNFIFLGSKITAGGDCSLKIKGHLLLGRNAMTNLDSVLRAETSLCQQRSR